MHVSNVWHTYIEAQPHPSDHARDTELEMGAHSLFLLESTVNRVYVSCIYVSVTRVSTCTSSIPTKRHILWPLVCVIKRERDN